MKKFWNSLSELGKWFILCFIFFCAFMIGRLSAEEKDQMPTSNPIEIIKKAF